MSAATLFLVYCFMTEVASLDYRDDALHSKFPPNWRVYINSLMRSGFASTDHKSMVKDVQFLYGGVDVNSRPCYTEYKEAHAYRGSSRIDRKRHPCSYDSITMSTEHRNNLYFLVFDIQVSPEFYLNLTFHQFNLLSGFRGCLDEMVVLIWWEGSKREREVQCGHRPAWTTLFTNHTLQVKYFSTLNDRICENCTVASSNLFFSYQVVPRGAFSRVHTNRPRGLQLVKQQSEFTIVANERTSRFGGLYSLFRKYIFYMNFHITGSQLHTISVDTRGGNYSNGPVYFDGPHTKGFPKIDITSDTVKIQSTGMYLSLQIENRNTQEEHIITFSSTNTIETAQVEVHISHDSPDKQYTFPVDSSACHNWPHLVMCMVKVSAPISHFVKFTITEANMDIPDYFQCIYRSLIIWETNRLNITGENYSLNKHDIDHASPVIRFCNKVLMRPFHDKILHGDTKNRRTPGYQDNPSSMENCAEHKLPQNTYSSSTNQVTLLYYMYRPYGMSIASFNATVRMSLTRCQGMTLQCLVTSDATRTEKVIDTQLDMHENALLSLGYGIPTHSVIAGKQCYRHAHSNTRYHQVILV